jgi:hypothetical protein
MDFADRLCLVLKGDDEESSYSQKRLLEWNDEIEEYLASGSSGSKSSSADDGESTIGTVEQMACALQHGILSAVRQMESFDQSDDDNMEEPVQLVKKHFIETREFVSFDQLFDYVRAGKNLLRWFIQIFLEASNGRVVPSPMRRLQFPGMIELLVSILEHTDCNANHHRYQDLARNISLYLFYATYNPFSLGDETAQEPLKHLIFDLSFPELALRMLSRPCTAPLALSLVRNLHNSIVSLQGAARIVRNTQIAWDAPAASSSAVAPWAPKESGTITFRSICLDMIQWALSSDPTFPGDKDDKRAELAIEILGAFYALRVGQELVPSRCNPRLMQGVVDILRLPFSKDDDKRTQQLILSLVSLLMDSDPTFGDYLLEADAVDNLLNILETQVTEVLDNTRVDNSATAALVPILAVLGKYGQANSRVQQKIKVHIFPLEAEERFLEKVREARSSNSDSKKNMSPLDAPSGTLRRKLATLLTWPECHIKRCTGELLWTLCSSNPTEYVHRVGFGNALPILSVKGHAQMPAPS